jgi:NAD(P)-dependent dehydrogenase (short-subunit alcohol dehydrogenase family)|tara:strand:+ start:116 stop:859 length:744 start_codon:yes stop_codon:yes gene_type:complete
MKKIIIIGASKGLGQAAAIWFSKLNYKIALLSRSHLNLEKVRKKCKNSKLHISLEINLLDISTIKKSINRAIKFLNGVDVVLHAAGGGLGLKENLISANDFLKLLNLNILSAVEINRLIVPKMKKGNIIHVGSIASYESVGSVGYNSAKATITAYVKTLGRELSKKNIIMTGILPGGFMAPENAMHRLKKNNKKAFNDFIKNRLPRKKMGNTNEIMPIIEFLASKNAGMMSGCLMPMDGGEGKSYNT